MKPKLFLGAALLFFAASIAVRWVWPADRASRDPAVRALEERFRSLSGYAAAVPEMEVRSNRLQAALWTAQSLEAFVAELPKGWTARAIASETRNGIALHRYAFSRDAAVRDFPEFQRVLRQLEDRPGARIDSVTLILNGDGKRFATTLITATIPVRNTP